jgi:Flp pilus assembly protein TadG
LILLLLLLLGLVGSYVYRVKHKTSNVATTMTQSSSGSVNLAAATKLVSTFYTKYLIDSESASSNVAALVKEYGTSNLQFYNSYYIGHGFNPILCAQDTPSKVVVKGASTSDGIAIVNVTELFGSMTMSPIKVSVVDRGELKLDALTCFSPAGNLPPVSVHN